MGIDLRVITVSTDEQNGSFVDQDSFARSSNKMPMAVKAVIKHAGITVCNISNEGATDFLYLMERSGRRIEETWSRAEHENSFSVLNYYLAVPLQKPPWFRIKVLLLDGSLRDVICL